MLPARALALGARTRTSLPPVVLRRICLQMCAGPEKSQFNLVNPSRFQSTASEAVVEEKRASKAQETRPRKEKQDARKREIWHRSKKLRDIVQQVQASVEAASSSDLSEAIEILEEGASYLREVQEAEKISDKALYNAFQPTLAVLFDKAMVDGASLGGKSVEQLLDMLVEQRVAHNFHFSQLMKKAFQKDTPDKLAEVLRIWVKFLEYTKMMELRSPSVFLNAETEFYKARGFKWSEARNVAFYAYIVQCAQGNVAPSSEAASKLLSVFPEASGIAPELPTYFWVKQAVEKWSGKLPKEEFNIFSKALNDMSYSEMDPNGPFALDLINRATKEYNPSRLEHIYKEMAQASARKNIPIKESRLNRLMFAFTEVGRYDRVFGIFGDMLAAGIKKPCANTFELVFKALGHPERVKNMTEMEKEEMCNMVEITLKSMEAAGVEMEPKTFAYVVFCFACVNKFDKVDDLMKKYSHIKVADATKNNIMVGLLMHGKIQEAEAKLKECLAEDEAFKPYTYTMNSFFSYYTKASRFDDAEKVLAFMRKKNIEEDVATVTTAVDLYFKMMAAQGKVPQVGTILAQFKKQNLNLTQGAVNSILDTLAKSGNSIEAVRGVYEYFTKQSPRYKYSKPLAATMIRAEVTSGSIFNGEELFKNYINKLENNPRMWNMMIRDLLYKDKNLAIEYYKKFKADEVSKPNFFTFYYMLTAFIRKNDAESVQWTLDELAGAGLKEFGGQLPALVNSLKGDYKVDQKLASDMKIGA